MSSLIELFCNVDDWCISHQEELEGFLLPFQGQKSKRGCRLHISEMMTLMIYFHLSHYRSFKHYYLDYVCQHLADYFPKLVSYTRFVELQPSLLLPLSAYLPSRFGEVSGISFIDSAKLSVCHNLRINRHRVFAGLAQRGKTSMGWFYGFKLHLVTNDCGDLLAVKITPGNVDDRAPVSKLSQHLFGKLFADRGYISQPLANQLLAKGIELVTTVRKNMKPKLMSLFDRLVLRKRFIIETIIDQLKNSSQIEHSRHRSIWNFMVNLITGLIAYTHQPKKPTLHLRPQQLTACAHINL